MIVKRHGIEHPHPAEVREKQISEVRFMARRLLRKRKTVNKKMGSQFLRETFERISWVPEIANGEIIEAMILEGFNLEQDGHNAYFCASWRKMY